jgi:hypothetical protein
MNFIISYTYMGIFLQSKFLLVTIRIPLIIIRYTPLIFFLGMAMGEGNLSLIIIQN